MSTSRRRPVTAQKSLPVTVAVVVGATRGAGRGIARALGEAGATVYCTGRSVRGGRSPCNRPETVEETAEMINAASGSAVALRVDHALEDEWRPSSNEWNASVAASMYLSTASPAKTQALQQRPPEQAIGCITPKDMLAARQAEIHAQRDRKLEEARKQPQFVVRRPREERRATFIVADETPYFRVADDTDAIEDSRRAAR